MSNGSWELLNRQRTFVAILTREMVSSAWSGSFRNLIIPDGCYRFIAGLPFHHARNQAVHDFLSMDFEYLFFLDDDVICPPDTIIRLQSHKLPIVSGMYFRRQPPICPCALRNQPGGRQWLTNFKMPEMVEVDYVGAGCLLIHRDVFRTVKHNSVSSPWFDWTVDRIDMEPNNRMSEDFTFCDRVREAGYKVLIDSSIQCRHAGLSTSGLGNNGQAEFVPLFV